MRLMLWGIMLLSGMGAGALLGQGMIRYRQIEQRRVVRDGGLSREVARVHLDQAGLAQAVEYLHRQSKANIVVN